jgi:transcriptional regulator with XRE-family HTH domain
MRKFPPTIVEIIKSSELNLNNLSQASGLSNAYLAKLVQGGINRPGKDKIASILIALNHTISEINRVLATYDYQALHLDDIDDILKNNRSRKIIGGNLPQYDHIYFDLLLVALERIGGDKLLVKNRPSGGLMPHDLYLQKEYPYEANDEAAIFRYNLTKQILVERSAIFLKNLRQGFATTTYICSSCLREYLARNLEPKESGNCTDRATLVCQYFANALSLAIKAPDTHRTYIIDRCPYFHFMIQDATGKSPKVSYPGRKLHHFDNQFDKRMLEGFTTDLPHIVAHFRHEVAMCAAAVPDRAQRDFPGIFVDHIFSLFARSGMKEKLQANLDDLLATSNLEFY